jgi:hypothetical protein
VEGKMTQVDREGSIISSDAMRQVCSDYGLSELNDNILAGKTIENLETTEEMLDWFWAIQRPQEAKNNTGVITKEDFQAMFKNAKKDLIWGSSSLYVVESTCRTR